MGGLILDKSLCGYSLKTACKIIGWLGVFSDLEDFCSRREFTCFYLHLCEVVGWGTLLVIIAVNLVMLMQEDKQDLSLIYISIVLGLPSLVIGYNVLVLIAVQKRWPVLLLPYMVFTMLHVVGGLLSIGISIRNQQYDGFFYALKAVFDTYFLLLVTSYYSQLRVINREPSATAV